MTDVGEVECADPLTPASPCPRCDAVALQWTEGVEGGLWCSACDTFYTPADDDEVEPATAGDYAAAVSRRRLRRELVELLARRAGALRRAQPSGGPDANSW